MCASGAGFTQGRGAHVLETFTHFYEKVVYDLAGYYMYSYLISVTIDD